MRALEYDDIEKFLRFNFSGAQLATHLATLDSLAAGIPLEGATLPDLIKQRGWLEGTRRALPRVFEVAITTPTEPA